ncbi:MAG: MBL fold metallo-hydrolase [Bacteroidetes bacterium]|nr:MBL fold metallo-hydrolase [Bacteroidota bacterium]
MKITFLGTGTSQGVPVIACKCDVCKSSDKKDKRLRSSILIETQGSSIVIDTGPDFRQQMLREDVGKLDAVIFTHEHKDHVAGLDDVRSFNYIQQKPMDVYALKRVNEALKREYAYVFSKDKYPGVPQLNLHNINDEKFSINNVTITPINVMHISLPILGYRIDDFTYITDASFISEEEKLKIKGSKILVVNALRKQKHFSHFCLSEALELIKEINPEKAYLTHIGHQMGLTKDVKNELPANVALAYDGQQIVI